VFKILYYGVNMQHSSLQKVSNSNVAQLVIFVLGFGVEATFLDII